MKHIANHNTLPSIRHKTNKKISSKIFIKITSFMHDGRRAFAKCINTYVAQTLF